MKEDDDCRELQVWCGNVAAVAQGADDQSFSAVHVWWLSVLYRTWGGERKLRKNKERAAQLQQRAQTTKGVWTWVGTTIDSLPQDCADTSTYTVRVHHGGDAHTNVHNCKSRIPQNKNSRTANGQRSREYEWTIQHSIRFFLFTWFS